tara:strand:+ start:106 stop:279 length:174 start_codon:yes stop_codon:yes gene_type:complete
MEEHFFDCPKCWETISMLFDPSLKTSQYFEDCEVCCQPLEIIYKRDAEGSVFIQVIE